MATFPSYGILLNRGYKEQRDPLLVRTEMDGGVPKQRPRATRGMVKRPVTYRFAAADYQSFVDWHRSDISNGTLWFDWTDPRTSTTKRGRIVNGDISDAAPINAAGTKWDVSFVLETWE